MTWTSEQIERHRSLLERFSRMQGKERSLSDDEVIRSLDQSREFWRWHDLVRCFNGVARHIGQHHVDHWVWVDSFTDYDPESTIAEWHALCAQGHCPCTVEECVVRHPGGGQCTRLVPREGTD